MLELLLDPNIWVSFVALALMEIVLGIDNLVFLSIASSRLPLRQQVIAQRIGLALAFIMRVVFLSALVWITHLTTPLFEIWEFEVSWRDIVLLAGGLFLLAKGTWEIHAMVEGNEDPGVKPGRSQFALVIVQIVVLDLVFSIDSIITAIGLTDVIPVMVAAIGLAIAVMMFAAAPVSRFINEHPTTKMLALSFLLLIGTLLIADGLHFHVPRGYVYFAICFSIGVEVLNLLAARRRARSTRSE